jgi:putative tricarboxylic transport membrane protein
MLNYVVFPIMRMGGSVRTTMSIPIPAALLALAPFFAVNAVDAASAWKPEKAIELIALNAPGGGPDRVLRIMAGIMQERRPLEVPVTLVNKPGGGGSVACAYLNQHPGDGHYVLLSAKQLLTNHIAGHGPSHAEFTPLAHLFSEYISVTVRLDSPLRTGRDLIERLRKDAGSLSFGISSSLGSPNHQGVATALKEAGIDIKKMRVVIFPSGGAASTAMLGGHVDVVPISVSFAASLLRQGQVRLLAVSAPTRLHGLLADVPTWREQGYDAVVSNWRGLWGPKGMTDAQIAYWEEAMRRMVESHEWKKELETNFWQSEYLRSGDARKYLDRDYVQARAFLADLGLAK